MDIKSLHNLLDPQEGQVESIPTVPTPTKRKRHNPKGQRWLDAYFGPAKRVASEAARLIGCKHHVQMGSYFKNKYKNEIAAREAELASSNVMSPEDCLKALKSIAEDIGHKDRLRAIELQLKVHGLLSDKLNITVDRKTALEELEQALIRAMDLVKKEENVVNSTAVVVEVTPTKALTTSS